MPRIRFRSLITVLPIYESSSFHPVNIIHSNSFIPYCVQSLFSFLFFFFFYSLVTSVAVKFETLSSARGKRWKIRSILRGLEFRINQFCDKHCQTPRVKREHPCVFDVLYLFRTRLVAFSPIFFIVQPCEIGRTARDSFVVDRLTSCAGMRRVSRTFENIWPKIAIFSQFVSISKYNKINNKFITS